MDELLFHKPASTKSGTPAWVKVEQYPSGRGQSAWPEGVGLEIDRFFKKSAVADRFGSNSSANAGWTSFDKDALYFKIDQVQSQLSRAIGALDARIDMLAKEVSLLSVPSDLTHQVLDSDSHAELAQLLGADDPALIAGEKIEGDLWVSLFDEVADSQLHQRVDLIPFAEAGLSSDDPAVRSAAGRAVAVLDKQNARALLSEAIEKEANQYVKESLVSALEALNL